MSAWDILAIFGRRWYVVLIGLLLTAGTVYHLREVPGVYATQTNVVFLAPLTPNSPNTISSPTSGVISTAGLVERLVNKGIEKSPTSGSVPLTGQGISTGHSIELPNAGGQWASNFNRPVLQIQVAGPSAAYVRSALEQLVAQINETSQSLQSEAGVRPSMLITTQVSPADPVIGYQQGHRRMGLLVALFLGLLLTGMAAIAADRFAGAWRRRS